MLIDRFYAPTESDLIYHYCPADAFLAICSSKRIRFSDIYSMNDFLEMHWGHHVWTQTWPQLNDIPNDFLKRLDEILFLSGFQATPLASCYSLGGDILSQWRAYADDGCGYSIGFQADILTRLAVRPLKVLYNEAQQLQELSSSIAALYRTENEAIEKESNEFYNVCLQLMLDLAAFKNPAFQEECEVRLLHSLGFEPSCKSMKLVDPGGIAFDTKHDAEIISFSMKKGIPVPYVDIDFTAGRQCSPIRQVVIGPKNDSRSSAVSVFLETMGIHDVNVVKAKASYR